MRQKLLLAAASLVLLPSVARAETKLEVTGTPRKAEVTVGQDIEIDVAVKNAGTEEADLAELTDDARSVSLEIKIDDAAKAAWDTKFQVEEKPGDTTLRSLGRLKLKPGEEAKLKEPLKVPAIATGSWSLTTVYAGLSPTKTYLADIRDEGSLVLKKDSAKTVKVVPGPKGETEVLAKVTTTFGTMTFKFFPKQALGSALNFVRLATGASTPDKRPWFDGKSFHRISSSVGVVQGGAPKPDGMGTFDYSIPLDAGVEHERGRVGMARSSDVNSGNCQFYICSNDNCKALNHVDPGYAIFAEVVKGRDVIETLAAVPTKGDGPNPEEPLTALKIESVKIQLASR